MIETLEGLGMLPMMKTLDDDPILGRFRAKPRVVATDEHTPPRPLPLPFPKPGNTGIVPPNRRTNGGIFPPWFRGRFLPKSEMTPAKPLPLPSPTPGNTGIVPPNRLPSPISIPKASDLVTMDAPIYQKPVDEDAWTPPDDALVQDQWGLDNQVDSGLRDDLYASQDYQADGEGDSLWGLGDAWDLIPALMPESPTPVSATSSGGGFLNSLGSFITNALPTAAQVYASVQATKKGNPVLGAQVGQQAQFQPMPQAGYQAGMTPGYAGPGYAGPSYAAPSWFSQRTIFPSMSNGAVVALGVAAAGAMLLILKKRRGA